MRPFPVAYYFVVTPIAGSNLGKISVVHFAMYVAVKLSQVCSTIESSCHSKLDVA